MDGLTQALIAMALWLLSFSGCVAFGAMALLGDDAAEIEVYTDSSEAGRLEDFDLTRFVDNLEPVPKEEDLEDPPEGTYWG